MIKYYLIIIVLAFLGSVASIYLKRAASANSLIKIILSLNLYIGGILYIISAVLDIYVLQFLDYSVVLPLTSLTYVWTLILSRIMLKEKITIKKAIGVMAIVLGAILVSVPA